MTRCHPGYVVDAIKAFKRCLLLDPENLHAYHSYLMSLNYLEISSGKGNRAKLDPGSVEGLKDGDEGLENSMLLHVFKEHEKWGKMKRK